MYSQEDADRMCRERQQYLELIHENIEYPYLLNEYRKEELDELVELMVDTGQRRWRKILCAIAAVSFRMHWCIWKVLHHRKRRCSLRKGYRVYLKPDG